MLLRYGREEVNLTLPPGIAATELKIKEMPVLKDPAGAVRKALLHPVGCPPLREVVQRGETVCLLVNDPTRVARSEVFLPLLVEELKEGGVREEDIFIVFTTGTHRPLTKEEMVSLVGRETASRFPMYNHDCRKGKELVYLGDTSRKTPVFMNRRVMAARRRILTGSIVHHFFAGFGGGRKALVPGVAGHETIQANHSMMLQETARGGVLAGNPVHEDLVEAALMAGGDFLLNVVLNEKKEFLRVFAGHLVQAHLEGCKLVQEVYGVALDAPADLVIASCGGHPKDINVYQSQKTLENAAAAVKEGGQLILLAECPEGVGSDTCESWARRYPTFEEMSRALEADFQIGGHKAYAIARSLQKATVYLVSRLPEETARLLGFVPCATLEEALAKALGRLDPAGGGAPLAYILPQGSLTVPVPGPEIQAQGNCK